MSDPTYQPTKETSMTIADPTENLLETIAAALGIADPDIVEIRLGQPILYVDNYTSVGLTEGRVNVDHALWQWPQRTRRTFRPRTDGTFNVAAIASILSEVTQ